MMKIAKALIIYGMCIFGAIVFFWDFTANDLQAAEIYKWVDSKGVEHYSDKPFSKGQKVHITVPKNKKTDEDDVVDEDGRFDASNTERLNKECEKARFNISAIESGSKLMKEDASGNQIEMSSAEVASQLQKNMSYVDLYCKKKNASSNET